MIQYMRVLEDSELRMITETGKNILAKYLIGNAPAYASHIALGCGAVPVEEVADLGNYELKSSLDFEMFRVPISSRGYVLEDGNTKIAFTAEIPSLERYEITEIGLYSAGSNPIISGYDSRILYSFSRQEPWLYGGTTIVPIDTPLDEASAPNNDVDTTSVVFQTNATNKFFANINRQKRNEQCRFLNNMMMVRGDMSPTGTSSANYLSLPTTSLNLEKNASSDIIKIAFSVVNRYGALPATKPKEVTINLQFVTATGATATLTGVAKDVASGGDADFTNNRYYIVSKSLGQLVTTSGFFWSQVNLVKIFVTVLDATNAVSDDYYVALDAIRLDNVSSENPIYGLTAYSVVVNQGTDGSTTYPTPVVKLPNSSSYVEFRLGVDI